MTLCSFWTTTAVSVGLFAAASALSAACSLHASGLAGAGGGSSTGSSSAQSGTSSSSASSSSGAAPVCGNSMVEAGEQCDDGNPVAGDGCDPMCFIEHPEVCPGTSISLALGQMLVINGNTTGASDKFMDAALTVGCGGQAAPGPDLVYAVRPAAPGLLKATLDTTYDHPYVHVRTQCPGMKQDEIACQGSPSSGINTVTIVASPGTVYYVAADSWQSQAGAFTLTLALQ